MTITIKMPKVLIFMSEYSDTLMIISSSPSTIWDSMLIKNFSSFICFISLLPPHKHPYLNSYFSKNFMFFNFYYIFYCFSFYKLWFVYHFECSPKKLDWYLEKWSLKRINFYSITSSVPVLKKAPHYQEWKTIPLKLTNL